MATEEEVTRFNKEIYADKKPSRLFIWLSIRSLSLYIRQFGWRGPLKHKRWRRLYWIGINRRLLVPVICCRLLKGGGCCFHKRKKMNFIINLLEQNLIYGNIMQKSNVSLKRFWFEVYHWWLFFGFYLMKAFLSSLLMIKIWANINANFITLMFAQVKEFILSAWLLLLIRSLQMFLSMKLSECLYKIIAKVVSNVYIALTKFLSNQGAFFYGWAYF